MRPANAHDACAVVTAVTAAGRACGGGGGGTDMRARGRGTPGVNLRMMDGGAHMAYGARGKATGRLHTNTALGLFNPQVHLRSDSEASSPEARPSFQS